MSMMMMICDVDAFMLTQVKLTQITVVYKIGIISFFLI